jgi:hypothetical protein
MTDQRIIVGTGWPFPAGPDGARTHAVEGDDAMRPPRRWALIIALALAIAAIGAATGWLVLRRDPSVQVGSSRSAA